MDFTEDELREVLQSYEQKRAQAASPSDGGESMTRVQVGQRDFLIYEEQASSGMSRLRQSIWGSKGRRAWQNSHDPFLRDEGHRVLAFGERRPQGLLSSSLWIIEEGPSD